MINFVNVHDPSKMVDSCTHSAPILTDSYHCRRNSHIGYLASAALQQMTGTVCVRQNDGYSCGPMVCLALRRLLLKRRRPTTLGDWHHTGDVVPIDSRFMTASAARDPLHNMCFGTIE
jgi:hypothetical protein